MTVNDARSEVARLNSSLLESELAVAVNPAVPFQVGDRTRVSWPQAKDAHGVFTEQVYASISEYRAFFRGSHYTSLLRDGGLIQASFDFKNAEMVANRFSFYPSPLALSEGTDLDWDLWNDLLEEELFAEIEGLATSGQDRNVIPTASSLRLRSPIRFDYDIESQSASEPQSHVHLSDAGARVPVHAALSLGQFAHFVITHFLPVVFDNTRQFNDHSF